MKSEVFIVKREGLSFLKAKQAMEKRANYLTVKENARIISVCWIPEFREWHLFYEPNRSDSVLTKGVDKP